LGTVYLARGLYASENMEMEIVSFTNFSGIFPAFLE
jgi:hypothetical protein